MRTNEETIVNVNNEDSERDGNVNNVNGKSNSKWHSVSIGGVSGIVLGIVESFAISGRAEASEVNDPVVNVDADATADNVETTNVSSVPMATTINDEMSFGDALEAARAELGAGGAFEWNGKIYTTYTPEEWKVMTATERDEFCASLIHTPDEIAAEAAAEAVATEAEAAAETVATEIDAAVTAAESPADVAAAELATKPVETPEPEASLEAQVAEPAPFATTVNDEMSFNQAFVAARAELGAGGVFEWHGKTYNTFYAEEWGKMSDEERREFQESIERPAADEPVVQNDEQVANAQEVNDAQPVDDEEKILEATIVEEDALANDVNVIGVFEDNVDGQDVYIGVAELDENNVMLVDVDHDGLFDVACADINADGNYTEDEIFATEISVDNLIAYADLNNANEILSADDMPDYMNDADVSMC